MNKVIIIIILVLITSLIGQAQIAIIPKSGINISDVTLKEEGVYYGNVVQNNSRNTQALVGFTAGIGFEYNLKGNWSLLQELLYSQKGFASIKSTSQYYFKSEYRFNYLEMPLLIKRTFVIKKFSIYLISGPSVGYLLNGRIKGNANFLGLNSSMNEKIIFTENYTSPTYLNANRVEIGFNIGGGVEYTFRKDSRLFLESRFNKGLTDFDRNQVVKNRVIALTAGVKLPL